MTEEKLQGNGPVHGYNVGDEVNVRAVVQDAHSDIWMHEIGKSPRLHLPVILGNGVKIMIPLDDVSPRPQ